MIEKGDYYALKASNWIILGFTSQKLQKLAGTLTSKIHLYT